MTNVPTDPTKPKCLKSSTSMVCSFVRFVNKTSYNVDTVWINYEGHRARYKTLRPDEFVDVNTYVGHPWIFLDSDTGNRMVVQMKEVFESEEGWKPEDKVQPQRKVYNITIPSKLLIKCRSTIEKGEGRIHKTTICL